MNEMTSCTQKLIDQQQFLYKIQSLTLPLKFFQLYIMNYGLKQVAWIFRMIYCNHCVVCTDLLKFIKLLCTVWQILPGSTYIFTTMVTNMMDLSSISVNTHVTRSHDLKPISVQLKLMSRKHPDPQRPLKMVAVVTPSACSGIDMQEVHNIIF